MRELAGLTLAVGFLCGVAEGAGAIVWAALAHLAFGEPRGSWPPTVYWEIACAVTVGAMLMYALTTGPILTERDELREQLRGGAE